MRILDFVKAKGSRQAAKIVLSQGLTVHSLGKKLVERGEEKKGRSQNENTFAARENYTYPIL